MSPCCVLTFVLLFYQVYFKTLLTEKNVSQYFNFSQYFIQNETSCFCANFVSSFFNLSPGICVKYFLSFPQKNLSPEKTETKLTKCFFGVACERDMLLIETSCNITIWGPLEPAA